MRNTVSAISSAIEKMAFLKSSKAIGSMAYYAARVNDVRGMAEQRALSRKEAGG